MIHFILLKYGCQIKSTSLPCDEYKARDIDQLIEQIVFWIKQAVLGVLS